MQSQDDRVNVEQLALEISDKLTLADNCREQWEKNDGDDAMRLTIAATLNKIGFQDIGLPGVRPHILKMVEQGEIQVFSTFNKLPPVGNCDISTSMGSWCMSREDADKVRDYLLPGKRETQGNNSTDDSGAPDDDSKRADAPTPAERRENLDMTTERGCRLRILENWPTIESLHGPSANGRQVLRVLTRALSSANKQEPTPTLKTVQNRLIDLRREGLIPG
jgi:hypothetical protein